MPTSAAIGSGAVPNDRKRPRPPALGRFIRGQRVAPDPVGAAVSHASPRGGLTPRHPFCGVRGYGHEASPSGGMLSPTCIPEGGVVHCRHPALAGSVCCSSGSSFRLHVVRQAKSAVRQSARRRHNSRAGSGCSSLSENVSRTRSRAPRPKCLGLILTGGSGRPHPTSVKQRSPVPSAQEYMSSRSRPASRDATNSAWSSRAPGPRCTECKTWDVPKPRSTERWWNPTDRRTGMAIAHPDCQRTGLMEVGIRSTRVTTAARSAAPSLWRRSAPG